MMAAALRNAQRVVARRKLLAQTVTGLANKMTNKSDKGKKSDTKKEEKIM